MTTQYRGSLSEMLCWRLFEPEINVNLYQILWKSTWLHRENALSKKLKSSIYRKLKRLGDPQPFDFTTRFYHLKYAGNYENLIDRHVYRYGGFEKHILELIKQILLNSENKRFIDVGCNVGQHSLFASQYARRVDAFDPFPEVLSKFQKNIRLNNLANIFIHPVGLGHENKLQQFYIPPEINSGMGSFLPDFHTENRKGPPLKIVRADDYFQVKQIHHCDLMKIDVEGFEKWVLLGLQNTLKKLRPFLIFEMSKGTSAAFANAGELMQSFPEKYCPFIINKISNKKKNSAYSLSPFAWHIDNKQIDVLATPKEKLPL